jgi:hypothetical protein
MVSILILTGGGVVDFAAYHIQAYFAYFLIFENAFVYYTVIMPMTMQHLLGVPG